MSEEQQSVSVDSFSRAETIELLQGTAQRFAELVTKLNSQARDYQLSKSAYKNLLSTSEKIFNSLQETLADSAKISSVPLEFERDFSENELTKLESSELLQKTVDLYQIMVEKITSEAIDYQLAMSDFESLVASTERIASSVEKALKTSSKTQNIPTESSTQFRESSASYNNGINWPWLGLVAIILILVISLTALTNPQPVSEEVALEVPPARLEFSAEQKAIAAIDKQIEKIITTYEIKSLAQINPNFVADTLTLEVADNWQELTPEKQEKIANKWLQDSRKLAFKKLEIIDREGDLIARSPVIGKNILILPE